MASIIKCEHGHYYDKDKYRTCPYCEAARQKAAAGQGGFESVQAGDGRPWAMDERDDDPTMPFSAMMPKMTNISLREPAQRKAPVDGGSWNGERGDDDDPTTPFDMPSRAKERYAGKPYVTGWIVGLNDEVKGRDFRLTAGMNWLGSSSKADIDLGKGHDIDEKRHCAVVYDAKGNQFLLFPGSGGGTCLNGRLIDKEEVLKAGDVIKAGSLEFEFVPYCREGHVWTKEDRKEQ